MDIDELDGKNVRWDFKNLKESGIDWWTRVLLRFWPLRGVMRLSRKMGMDPLQAEKAHAAFSAAKRIDIIPSRAGGRGFQLILDGHTALYFDQDGDHFVYDGWETGSYGKGDVTIFDDIKRGA